jgi:hypothetical protein
MRSEFVSSAIATGSAGAAGYNLVKSGEAPRVMRVGARILISKEAVVDWRREREQATRKEGGRGGDRRSREAAATAA